MVEPFPYFRWSVWRIGYESADHLTPLPGQWTGRGELPTILIYRCLFRSFYLFNSSSSALLRDLILDGKAHFLDPYCLAEMSGTYLTQN